MVENVIEAMVDAVLVIDVEGRITLANTAASHLTGLSLDELRAMPISQVLVDDSSGLRTLVRRRIEEGEVLRREESWLVTRTGDKIPVSVTGSPVLGTDGALQGIVIVARDVRELRQLLTDKEIEIVRRRDAEEELRAAKASIEEQLEEARRHLLLAERRATLGTLAGGVGHELRNIAQIQVAAVDELAAALAAGEDLAQMMRAMLPDLERVGAHITAHGQRLMQLARPGPDLVESLDLNDVVVDVLAMLRGAGKFRRLEVVTTFDATAKLQVTVNRTRIEQILVNLIVNAIDAIGDRAPAVITIGTRVEGARAMCEVQDTGCGIPPDQLDTIFEPFFTTKPEDLGTGLGLPVAREMVQAYGGNLRVRSQLGVGTTFTFDLPR